MAEPLPTLIKLAGHKVEEAQRRMAETGAKIQEVERALLSLADELKRGGELAAESGNITLFQQAGAYVARAMKEEERLKQERTALMELLETQRKLLAERFAEQKRYETLWQRKQQRLKRERAGKQQAALDDIAGVRDWFARKD